MFKVNCFSEPGPEGSEPNDSQSPGPLGFLVKHFGVVVLQYLPARKWHKIGCCRSQSFPERKAEMGFLNLVILEL